MKYFLPLSSVSLFSFINYPISLKHQFLHSPVFSLLCFYRSSCPLLSFAGLLSYFILPYQFCCPLLGSEMLPIFRPTVFIATLYFISVYLRFNMICNFSCYLKIKHFSCWFFNAFILQYTLFIF